MFEADGVTVKGRGTTPPYIPFRTLKTFFHDLSEHGVPGRIDSSVLKRFSGAAQRQLRTALRFLDLVDQDDHPTDDLRQLSAAFGKDTWPAELERLLRSRYSPVLERVDLASASPSQVNQAFKQGFGANASDDVLRKCQLFFFQAVQEAGIPLSKRIPVITRMRAPSSRKPAARSDSGTGGNGATGKKDGTTLGGSQEKSTPPPPIQPLVENKSPEQTLLDILDPEAMDDNQQEAVWTLLKYLKAKKVQTVV